MKKLFVLLTAVSLFLQATVHFASAEDMGKLCILVDACKEMQAVGYQEAMDAVFAVRAPSSCETDVFIFGLVRERAGAAAELKFALRTEQSKKNPLNYVLPTCPLEELDSPEMAKGMTVQLRPYDGVILLTRDADVSTAPWAGRDMFCRVVGVSPRSKSTDLQDSIATAINDFAGFIEQKPEISLSMAKTDHFVGDELSVRLLGKADHANLSFGDGSGEVPIAGLAPHNGKDYSHVYKQPGTYKIRVAASLRVGKQERATSKAFSVVIKPAPEPAIELTVENGTHLVGDDVKFWVTAEAGSVEIDYGDGSQDRLGLCTPENPQAKKHVYRTSGDYTVTATATLSTMGKTRSKMDKGTVRIMPLPPSPPKAVAPGPAAPPSPSPPPEIKLTPVGKIHRAGSPVKVHVSGAADSVELSFGDGGRETLQKISADGQDKQHSYKTAGSYVVKAVAKRNGQEKSVEIRLDVKEPPPPELEIMGRSVKCDGDAVSPSHNVGSDVWTFRCAADAKLEFSISLPVDDATVQWELDGKSIGEEERCTLRSGLEAGSHEINVVVTSKGAEVEEIWRFETEASGGAVGFLFPLILVLIIGVGAHFLLCTVKRPKLELLYGDETVPFKWHPWYRFYAEIEVGESTFVYCEARKIEDSWEVRFWTNAENVKFDGELPLETRCGDDWKDYGKASGKKIGGRVVAIDEEGESREKKVKNVLY